MAEQGSHIHVWKADLAAALPSALTRLCELAFHDRFGSTDVRSKVQNSFVARVVDQLRALYRQDKLHRVIPSENQLACFAKEWADSRGLHLFDWRSLVSGRELWERARALQWDAHDDPATRMPHVVQLARGLADALSK